MQPVRFVEDALNALLDLSGRRLGPRTLSSEPLASHVKAGMANPSSSLLPSLEEQQLRFVAARSLMAVPQMRHRRGSDSSRGYAVEPVQVSTDAPRKGSRNQRGQKLTTDPVVSPQLGESRARRHSREPGPRKTAYTLQKEHRRDLENLVCELEERVELLRFHAGLPTRAHKEEMLTVRRSNTDVDQHIHASRQSVVCLQSMINQELQLPRVNPLSMLIHLPCDQTQRRAIIHGMKDVKLRRAAEYCVEHFRHLDASNSYLCEERFPTEDGAYHCNRWEMNAFPNFQSARQLYDVLLFWMSNMEISVTEMLNQIAVREDSEDIDPTIWNHRIVTQAEDVGCTEELNYVGFAQFYNGHDLLDGAPLGVITNDTVDVDDLYPYKPLERTRKDFQASHVICEVMDPDTKRKTVVVKSVCRIAQLEPQFPVEPRVIKKLHAYMTRWSAFMVQYLHEYVVPIDSNAEIRKSSDTRM